LVLGGKLNYCLKFVMKFYLTMFLIYHSKHLKKVGMNSTSMGHIKNTFKEVHIMTNKIIYLIEM